MADSYKPHPPEFYSIAWNTAARKAARLRDPDNVCWVSVDWGKTQAAALNRMRRLRAFRKGLEASPQSIPEVAEAFAQDYEMVFRKVALIASFDSSPRPVWDVQVGFKWVGGRAAIESLRGEV